MAKVYVAGRVSDIERVRATQALFRYYQHEITFDWTGPEGAVKSDWRTAPEQALEISSKEVIACQECDLLVLLSDDGRGLGCFIEMGVAIGAGKEVWVVDTPRESVFFYYYNVMKVRGDDLPEMIKNYEVARSWEM